MPSSSRPYQSKLLRFVLKQWQQGLDRQDRAWRQLQSTANWGAQVAIFPFYAIMRAVERASFAIGSGHNADQAGAPASPAQGNVTDIEHSLTAILSHTQQILSLDQKEQLEIAPKSGLSHQKPSFLGTIIGQLRQLLPNQPQAPNSSTAITKRRSEHLTTTQSRPSSGELITGQRGEINTGNASNLMQNGTTLASSLKTRKLVLVNIKNEVFDIFTPAQQTDLQHYITRIMLAYERSRYQQKQIAIRQPQKLPITTRLALEGNIGSKQTALTPILIHAQKLLSSKQQKQLAIAPKASLIHQAQELLTGAIAKIWRPGKLATANTVDINRQSTSQLAQNDITLASSLISQNLVLVNLKNEVFDIFTPAQQLSLKEYIDWVLLNYKQAQAQATAISIRRSKRLSVKTILAIGGVFMTALPMEFQKAWAQISPGPQPPQLPHIQTNSIQAAPSARIFYPQTSTSNTVKTRVRQLPHHPERVRRRLTSNSPDAFEANVNDVSYVEHPLEKLLRWLDQILTWCEQRWQQWTQKLR